MLEPSLPLYGKTYLHTHIKCLHNHRNNGHAGSFHIAFRQAGSYINALTSSKGRSVHLATISDAIPSASKFFAVDTALS